MNELLGRADERALLDRTLDAARQGRSGVLVVRGEPGIGKSTLLDHAATAGADFHVVRLDGVESEMGLSFAGLYQVLRPHLGRLDRLPAPQRDALRLAFGLQHGKAPDRFLIGLASLGLLADRKAGPPLLCVVDDAQWLDEESADALGFVARRLFADSVAMIFGVRDPASRPGLLDGLPEQRLGGLGAPEATRLLSAVPGPRLERSVIERIVTETGGNPLALIEISHGLSPEQRAGDWPLPEPLPLGRRLEHRYLQDVRRLPTDTQTLLLAAAADPTSDPGLLWRSGAQLGFTSASAAPAETQSLITIRDTVQFRHPLIRSAVYYGAPLVQRQRVHAALASATPTGQPDRRAWHQALAATGPDEVVAADLELAASRARSRGGWTTAEALYRHAAMLSIDHPTQARRQLSAAEASWNAGAPGRAQALLDDAATYRADAHHLGLVQRMQGRIFHMLRRPGDATSALLSAATGVSKVDVRLARDILVEAIVQAQINGQLAPAGTTRLDVAKLARSLTLPPREPTTVGDILLDADTVLQLHGLTAAAPQLRRAIDAVSSLAAEPPQMFQWLAAACADATILSDDVRLHELAWRMESLARRHGAVIPLSLALSHAGASELLAGLLPEAERCFVERAAIEEARGNDHHIGDLLVAAWRGQATRARALIDVVTAEAARQGQGYQLVYADYARCVIELGLGHYRAAHLSLADRIDDSSQIKFALPDLVEAAHRAGERDVAQVLLARLADLAAASRVHATLGFLARSRAVVAGDAPEAEGLHQEAIDHHTRTRGPVHLARSHLVYGEWLRRVRRPRDAREHLRAAHDSFSEMGATAFAARARQELSASGETVHSRIGAHTRDLTPQEARVASLAAGGATNAEIAAQLFLSANTIDYHLRKVFRKLGVTSRQQLSRTDPDVAQGSARVSPDGAAAAMRAPR